VPASDSVSTAAPPSSIGTKRAKRPCNKRTRGEDSDSDDAFGTPPPKCTSREITATANGKTAIKQAPSSQKPALKKPMSKKTAIKKPAPAPPAPSTRPSRNRKAPERLEDLQEKSKPKSLPNKKGPSKVFDPIYITTNSGSRLVKADIYVCGSPQVKSCMTELTHPSTCSSRARHGPASAQSSKQPSSRCFPRMLQTNPCLPRSRRVRLKTLVQQPSH